MMSIASVPRVKESTVTAHRSGAVRRHPLRSALLFALMAALHVAGCSDDDDNDQRDAGGQTIDGPAQGDDRGVPEAGVPQGTPFNAAASLGELARYTVNLEALTYSLQITASAFGLEGTRQDGVLTANPDGTYTPSGAPAARLMVVPETLLIGAETVELAGQGRLLLFAGVPSLDSPYLAGEIAGLYNTLEYSCDKTRDPQCGEDAYFTTPGTLEVAANGTFTLCVRGDLDNTAAHPCAHTQQGSLVDREDGVLAIRIGAVDIGHAMILPSSGGGKLFILDLMDTPATAPGLLIGVQKTPLTGAALAGTFRFTGDDGNHGEVSVDDSRDTYHGTLVEPGLAPQAYGGTFIRDQPWAGWLTATDAVTGATTHALILPDVGAWLNTSLEQGQNTWIDVGVRLP